MKAVLLAGGQGTRLRPLTLNTPKPVVPVFGRAFLRYQIDRILQVPEIDEVILSLNYQPDRVEKVFGDGSEIGIRIRYVVEPTPLGTAGGIKFASRGVTDTIAVFNGDVLTEIDLAAVVARHRERRATATIVLTPVENPVAYGLVETGPQGDVHRFIEKPDPAQITTNLINAGIYVLEPSTFDRIPDGVPCSIEREYFPSLVMRGETFVAYRYDGYWIDIGTPVKYAQVHRDILEGRFQAVPFNTPNAPRTAVAPDVTVGAGATIEGPVFIDAGVTIGEGATVGPNTVLGRGCHIGAGSIVAGSVVWPGTRVGRNGTIVDALVGEACQLGDSVSVLAGAVLGDRTVLTDYTRF
jgi:NDP-sugar pyrophosphorylase family protein